MAKEAALVVRWANPVRGRESKALEVFQDFLVFWGKKAADGKCSEPEAYLAGDGFGGMAVIKGQSDALNEILETDEYIDLITTGQLIVEDLHHQTFYTGNEVMTSTQRYYTKLQELGLA